MARMSVVLGVILALLAGSAGAWGALRPQRPPFLVAGATEIQVAPLGSNEWQISYRAPGASGAWYAEVVQQLEREHWRSPDRKEYAALNRTYMRASSIGVGDVRAWVYVRLDPFQPDVAQIRLRRVVVFPWWPRLVRHVRAAWPSRLFIPGTP